MQIHELNSPRRTDEGLGSWAKAVGKAAATGLAQAVSPGLGTTQNMSTKSAGILDPKKKLAAVMKEPAMVKLATQYAKEWSQMPQMQATPVPEAIAERVSVPGTVATKPAAVPAQGFNADNLMKLPGMQKYAAPAAGTQPQTQPGTRVNKADPNNPNIKDQNRYVQGRAGFGSGSDATKFAKYDPATSAVANAGQGINNMVKGGVAAQQQAAPEKPTGTAMPLKPFQVPGAGTDPTPTATKPGQAATTTPAKSTGTAMPLKPYQVPGAGTDPTPTATKPGQAATTTPAKSTGTAMPLKPFQVPGAGTNPTPAAAVGYKTAAAPQNSAAATYLKNFLAFANQKIAMRDSSTYKMIGLADVEKSKLKPELDAAKQAVVAAQGNPTATEAAVKNYILTAMAGAQLIASENAVAAATPQAPAYGQQAATPGAQTGTASAPAPAAATGQLTGSNAVALLNKAGLGTKVLTPAGQAIQAVTNNKQLSTTGDSVIDTMLEGMGYTVS